MDIKEHKKTFQLERMILFSDAVFAIAITLLVIELKLPEMETVNNQSLADALWHTIPHFFSFLMSFLIIAIYWVAHHRMFYYVIHYDLRLVWLNIFLLLFIALMPFSSNVYGVYSGLNTAFFFYVFNISMVSLFLFLMYHYIGKPEKKLSHGLENPRLVRFYKARALAVPLCFWLGVIIALCFSSPWGTAISRMTPMLIWPVFMIIKRKYRDVAFL